MSFNRQKSLLSCSVAFSIIPTFGLARVIHPQVHMGPDQDLEYEGNMSDYTQEDREND